MMPQVLWKKLMACMCFSPVMVHISDYQENTNHVLVWRAVLLNALLHLSAEDTVAIFSVLLCPLVGGVGAWL